MPIIDKFKDVGNLYVYGKIESGTIVEDQTVTILPERTQLVIREISNAKDERLPFASAGENVRIRVKGVD
jgi:peptide chain release factor subunit 3